METGLGIEPSSDAVRRRSAGLQPAGSASSLDRSVTRVIQATHPPPAFGRRLVSVPGRFNGHVSSLMHGTVHVEECGPHSAREWHVWTEKADSSCTPIWATSIRAEAQRIVDELHLRLTRLAADLPVDAPMAVELADEGQS